MRSPRLCRRLQRPHPSTGQHHRIEKSQSCRRRRRRWCCCCWVRGGKGPDLVSVGAGLSFGSCTTTLCCAALCANNTSPSMYSKHSSHCTTPEGTRTAPLADCADVQLCVLFFMLKDNQSDEPFFKSLFDELNSLILIGNHE